MDNKVLYQLNIKDFLSEKSINLICSLILIVLDKDIFVDKIEKSIKKIKKK